MSQILVIEDDLEFKDVLKDLLERQNYDVIAASDGDEGVALYKEYFPDLIITDLMMPKKGGLSVIDDLKQEFPSVKIIAISGGGELEAEMHLNISRALLADRTLKKPFPNDDLIETINELIG